MNKAVVLGCNYYIGLSVIRCLGVEGVHVVACDYDFENSYGARSKYISEFLKVYNLNKINFFIKKSLNELIHIYNVCLAYTLYFRHKYILCQLLIG